MTSQVRIDHAEGGVATVTVTLATERDSDVRHARDVPAVAREVARALRPDAQLAVLQADICRSDLLVEMEALALLR